ncbi:MAG: protein kinase [bacterium]
MADHDPPRFSPDEAAAADDPFIDRVIVGKFRLERLLGVGAMGRVYEAEHLSLSKKVAVKVLHQHLMGDDGLGRRFHREAKSASTLNHPNSIAIMDFGQDTDGTLYIAMELLAGRSLGDVLHEEAPLPLDRTVRILAQVCLALDEAHHNNIVHRDLKAENVMVLTRRGESDYVKVCDFGIAKVQDPKGDNPDSAITVAGLVCGTPEYMSPEQARGETLDGRSDLYSLGILLYYMVTDRLPFTAETALGCVTKHLTEQPKPPTEMRPDLDIPPILEEFILRTIAKEVDRRPPTATAFREELEEIAGKIARGETSAPVSTTDAQDELEPVARGGSRVWLIAILAAVAVGAGVGGTILLRDRPGTGAGARSTADSSPGVRPDAAQPGVDGALSPGGRRDASAPVTVGSDAGRPVDTRSRRRRRRPGIRPMRPMRPRDPPRGTARPKKTAFDEAYSKARAAFNAGQVGAALAEFKKALQHRPGHAASIKSIGQCYVRLGMPCRALQYFRRYQRLRPGSFFIKRHIDTLAPRCPGK